MRLLGSLERTLFVVGLFLAAIFVGGYLHRKFAARAELARFHELRVTHDAAEETVQQPAIRINFSQWSKKRIDDYERSLTQYVDPPLALLRIAKLGLEVPILEGTDDLVLNRGVGHISGTDVPGGGGNVGIAGHRDGFFRVLKDIVPGDTIELLKLQGSDVYRVDEIVIVPPDDVSVLQSRSVPSLTLVTCYPFYFVGSAPERYIVKASIVDSSGTHPKLELTQQRR